MGFEPTRAEHNGLAVHHLNHSVTSSSARAFLLQCPTGASSNILPLERQPTSSDAQGLMVACNKSLCYKVDKSAELVLWLKVVPSRTFANYMQVLLGAQVAMAEHAFLSFAWCSVALGAMADHGFPSSEIEKVPPRFELGSLDSESRVLTITPWNLGWIQWRF